VALRRAAERAGWAISGFHSVLPDKLVALVVLSCRAAIKNMIYVGVVAKLLDIEMSN
jgi:hypothetical protein